MKLVMTNNTIIEIVPTTVKHVKELSLNLREADKLEAIRIGTDPKRECFNLYKKSIWKQTGLIDGKVAAIWGVYGSLTSDVGKVFLITTKEVEKISPLKFIRIYKEQIKQLHNLFPVLENYVDANYHQAVRALKVAGATLSKPLTLGPEESLFRKFSV